MRPTPAEIIAGVRRVLAEVVEPEVGSEHARARLREVRAVLAQLDWDNVVPTLDAQAAELRLLLAECREWVHRDDRRRDHFAEAAVELPSRQQQATGSFAERNAAAARDGATVVALIPPLEGWLAAHPEDEAGHRIRSRLLDHYSH